MKKKLKVVTGKNEVVENKHMDLSEIITGRKSSKFGKYANREAYKKALYDMTHIELCEEIMRLGETASSEKEFCRNKCLAIYDRAQKPRITTIPLVSSSSLEDIINKGK